MRTRIEGIRARLALYQFAEDAFGTPRPAWHRACVIGGRRYVLTEDLTFCLQALALCRQFLTLPSPEAETALRTALAEPDT